MQEMDRDLPTLEEEHEVRANVFACQNYFKRLLAPVFLGCQQKGLTRHVHA
jgi:hypothetical protein